MWIHQHLRCILDKFKIESYLSPDALLKIIREFNFGVGHDSWIEDHSSIFATLCCRDIFKDIQFVLAHLLFRASFGFEPVGHAESESCEINSEMNTSN
jgi:hypothetical protein